ncbi:MAG: hypothetical protein ACXVSL_07145 [Solirubrobacteraceae bacterium]
MWLLMAQQRGGTRWSTQAIPDVSAAALGYLNGVSCETQTDCMAVGAYVNSSNVQVTWAERWNGSSWILAATPNLPGATKSGLDAVSCTSATSCVAVGSVCFARLNSEDQCWGSSGEAHPDLIAERWNGRVWSVERLPTAPGSGSRVLNGVSCPSPSTCLAVGASDTGALVFSWNGSGWSSQAPSIPTGTQLDELDGVSCSWPVACTAVGLGASTVNGQTDSVEIAARWAGSSWSIENLQDTPDGARSGAVSCPTSSRCIAVSGSFARTWDGTHWALQRVPTPRGVESDITLRAVSCWGQVSCTAIGTAPTKISGGEILGSLAEVWNGTRWVGEVLPALPLTGSSQLTAVSCATAATCVAVGNYAISPGDSRTRPLVERGQEVSNARRGTVPR